MVSCTDVSNEMEYTDNRNNTNNSNNNTKMITDYGPSRKNITIAVNYELSMVDQFLGGNATTTTTTTTNTTTNTAISTENRKRRNYVESVRDPTRSPSPYTIAQPKQPQQHDVNNKNNSISSSNNDAKATMQNMTNTTASSATTPRQTRSGSTLESVTNDYDHSINIPEQQAEPEQRRVTRRNPKSSGSFSATPAHHQQHAHYQRRSARDRGKKEIPLARTRVRYDMQEVPPARRNRAFLNKFPVWWLPKPEKKRKRELPTDPDDFERSGKAPRRSSRLNGAGNDENDPPSGENHLASRIPQFKEGMSVVWIPTKRSEWEDCVGEMTAVCTTAAIRRHAECLKRGFAEPFHAPLSRDYIRDRIDIDDPMNGYQIRHKSGGWLQGFILWTNFTTWTHYFKWDSRHPKSGFPASSANTNAKIDLDGCLADELERQPRSGDPMGGGVVFSGLAEIALVGGLGCGEYLLRMALDDIRSKRMYKYVVLQATDQSKTFYERFGFVRVGAICRYGEDDVDDEDGEQKNGGPIMGYRHWTHANESDRSLRKHGGPSYMMCLKLPDEAEMVDYCDSCGQPKEAEKPQTFLDAMLELVVQEKPTVEPLGATATPTPKPSRRGNALIGNSSGGNDIYLNSSKRKPSRKASSSTSAHRPSESASAPKNRQESVDIDHHASKEEAADLPTMRRRGMSEETNSSTKLDAVMQRKSEDSRPAETTVAQESPLASTPERASSGEPTIAQLRDDSAKHDEPADSDSVSEEPVKDQQTSGLTKEKDPVNREQRNDSTKESVRGEQPSKTDPSKSEDESNSRKGKTGPPLEEESKTKTLSEQKEQAVSTEFESPDRHEEDAGTTAKSPSTSEKASGGMGASKDVSEVSRRARSKEDLAADTINRTQGRTSKLPSTEPSADDSTSSDDETVAPPLESDMDDRDDKSSDSSENSIGRVTRTTSAATSVKSSGDGSPSKSIDGEVSAFLEAAARRRPVPIVKNNLLKQKVKSYPRSRIHYFNRVVKRKDGPDEYYFVLHYNEALGVIRIVPMMAKGRLSGKREGRPRFQAVIEETDANFQTVLASQYEVVSAVMVMKTPIVASEAWDIEDFMETGA